MAVLIKLVEIGPQVPGFLLVLDAGEDHLGVGNLGARILDVFFKRRLIPRDIRTLVGVAVAIALDAARLATIETIEYRPNLVFGNVRFASKADLDHRRVMSALPPKADIWECCCGELIVANTLTAQI